MPQSFLTFVFFPGDPLPNGVSRRRNSDELSEIGRRAFPKMEPAGAVLGGEQVIFT